MHGALARACCGLRHQIPPAFAASGLPSAPWPLPERNHFSLKCHIAA